MKKNLYFLKDKKCKVYTIDNNPHSVLDPDVTVLIGELWCYTKQVNQNLVAEAGAIYANSETRLFVFNYNKDITQGCLIEYRDQWFKATRVDTTDDYNGEMFVYCEDHDNDSSGSGSGEGVPLFG